MKRMPRVSLRFCVATLILLTLLASQASAGTFQPEAVEDQTPLAPLANPVPAFYQPRYVSGFGQDQVFTLFIEDRDSDFAISFVATTTGPNGFPAAATSTNIADTHFTVKDWPVAVEGAQYAYRGWGAVGNNPEHHFYVSNDLVNWTLIATFTIPNAPEFTSAIGRV